MSAVKVLVLLVLICALSGINALDEDIQGNILRRLVALETQLAEVTQRGKQQLIFLMRMMFNFFNRRRIKISNLRFDGNQH